jgi:hypothetical protein
VRGNPTSRAAPKPGAARGPDDQTKWFPNPIITSFTRPISGSHLWSPTLRIVASAIGGELADNNYFNKCWRIEVKVSVSSQELWKEKKTDRSIRTSSRCISVCSSKVHLIPFGGSNRYTATALIIRRSGLASERGRLTGGSILFCPFGLTVAGAAPARVVAPAARQRPRR